MVLITIHCNALKEQLASVNETIHFLGQYLSLKKVYSEFMASGKKGAFRNLHRGEIQKYEEAIAYLEQRYEHDCIPSLKDVKAEKIQLQKQLTGYQSEFRRITSERKKWKTVRTNLDAFLGSSERLVTEYHSK